MRQGGAWIPHARVRFLTLEQNKGGNGYGLRGPPKSPLNSPPFHDSGSLAIGQDFFLAAFFAASPQVTPHQKLALAIGQREEVGGEPSEWV